LHVSGYGSQILIYSYNRPVKWGCPGTTVLRNILSFSATASDAERSGWSVGPVRAYGGFFLSPNEHTAGMCPISSTLDAADGNVFCNPVLGKAGTEARGLFGSVGVPPLRLSQWQAAKLMAAGPMDAHSVVADPMFADSSAGNFTLLPGSPALPLGFQQLPAIHAPSKRPSV
jgi:hypothetical protein